MSERDGGRLSVTASGAEARAYRELRAQIRIHQPSELPIPVPFVRIDECVSGIAEKRLRQHIRQRGTVANTKDGVRKISVIDKETHAACLFGFGISGNSTQSVVCLATSGGLRRGQGIIFENALERWLAHPCPDCSQSP